MQFCYLGPSFLGLYRFRGLVLVVPLVKISANSVYDCTCLWSGICEVRVRSGSKVESRSKGSHGQGEGRILRSMSR